MTYQLDINTNDNTDAIPVAGISMSASVRLLSGTWSSAVVTMQRSSNGSSWEGFLPPVVFFANEMSNITDIYGVAYVRFIVSTTNGSTGTASVQFTITEVPAWASGGGGSGNSTSATVDFGFASGKQGDIATVTVTGQTWVAAGSEIICMPFAVATADHDADDYAVEGITAYASNIVAGTGFDVTARAPNGSWGRYTIHCLGV